MAKLYSLSQPRLSLAWSIKRRTAGHEPHRVRQIIRLHAVECSIRRRKNRRGTVRWLATSRETVRRAGVVMESPAGLPHSRTQELTFNDVRLRSDRNAAGPLGFVPALCRFHIAAPPTRPPPTSRQSDTAVPASSSRCRNARAPNISELPAVPPVLEPTRGTRHWRLAPRSPAIPG